jgi:hypothetical protein
MNPSTHTVENLPVAGALYERCRSAHGLRGQFPARPPRGWAAMRCINIRTHSWLNWIYPVAF